jgi:hypothetical protein
MKKTAAAALAVLIGVTAIVGTAETASARDGRNAALAAGAAVGLGIGALLAAPRYDGGYEVAPPRYAAAPSYSDDGYRTPPPRRAAPAGWRAHADWCYDNYRSYDERTDTYVGRDGYAYRCRGSY